MEIRNFVYVRLYNIYVFGMHKYLDWMNISRLIKAITILDPSKYLLDTYLLQYKAYWLDT